MWSPDRAVAVRVSTRAKPRGIGRGRDSKGPRGSILIRYVDATALAKRYVQEAGSAAVRRHLRSGRVATSRLSAVEIASALARRWREGTIAVADRDRAVQRLNQDIAACILVELSAEVCEHAQRLLARHALRSGDAIQLASGLYLQRETRQRVSFAAFDDPLNAAARTEGLAVIALV